MKNRSEKEKEREKDKEREKERERDKIKEKDDKQDIINDKSENWSKLYKIIKKEYGLNPAALTIEEK